MAQEEWFTLDSITPSQDDSKLHCITVDSPGKQFLAGKTRFPTHNSEQGKAEDEMKGEAQMIIGSIARLGRAAGVHLVIATQRPDATLLPGETKANLGVRINCGSTGSTASSMILDSGEGTQVKSNPRGRLFLKIFRSGDHGQGFFAEQEWIDEYLSSQGLNPDGTPISQPRSQLANVTDISQFEGTDLDTQEGVDNAAIIERIRQEEAQGNYGGSELLADDEVDDEDDWNFDGDDDEDWRDNDAVDEDSDDEPEAPTDRPVFGGKKEDGNPWDRPEDDWSSELEQLIEENRS